MAVKAGKKRNIYIDTENLVQASLELGFQIDYKRFRVWLSQRYEAEKIYLFMGYVQRFYDRYEYLKVCGYMIVFKKTVEGGNGVIKGNCDGELILKVAEDFYESGLKSCILISGDGDFRCITDFLKSHDVDQSILAPSISRCSSLLKQAGVDLSFLNEEYAKFSSIIVQNEKAPETDSSE